MPSDDPMHIANVRAQHEAGSAERQLWWGVAWEIDGPPVTPVGMLRRALSPGNEQDSDAPQ